MSKCNLNIKLFADGADLVGIQNMAENDRIQGFTTNPTLMRKAGVTDYRSFAGKVLEVVRDRPVSFEVLSDDFDEMKHQALEIASWGKNVFVKIPVMNTQKLFAGPLIRELAKQRVQLNVTAVMTLEQISAIVECLQDQVSSIISVFAGRIADTGVDPIPIMKEAIVIMQKKPKTELLWASPRELLNIVQANDIGCHIITATHDILKKLPLLGKDHLEYSLETVQMFYQDALSAGFTISDARQCISA